MGKRHIVPFIVGENGAGSDSIFLRGVVSERTVGIDVNRPGEVLAGTMNELEELTFCIAFDAEHQSEGMHCLLAGETDCLAVGECV